MTKLQILKTFSAIFLGVFLGLFVFVSVGQIIFPQFYKAYLVTSGSMEPQIQTGSVVFSHPSTNYKEGDVITFSSDGSKKNLTTHRISAIKTEENNLYFQTKGDANEDPDIDLVTKSQILGRVDLVIPLLGYIVNFVKTPSGFILLVIVPATIVIYEEAKSLGDELIKQIKKFTKKNPQGKNLLSKSINRSNAFYLSILAPFVAVAIIVAVAKSSSYFSDKEQNVGNSLTASEQFPSPTPQP